MTCTSLVVAHSAVRLLQPQRSRMSREKCLPLGPDFERTHAAFASVPSHAAQSALPARTVGRHASLKDFSWNWTSCLGEGWAASTSATEESGCVWTWAIRANVHRDERHTTETTATSAASAQLAYDELVTVTWIAMRGDSAHASAVV